MAFQVSPGVNVSEIDATNVVPAVSTSDAGFAAAFVWGPADKITTISSEVDLVNTFGKPDSDTQINWYTAASFLAYAGSLQIARTLGDASYNSSDGTASGVEGVIVDVEDLTPTPSAAWQASQTHAAFAQTGATNPAGGTGATFSAVTSANGLIVTFTLVAAGTGYNSGDEITFTDPGSSANTATITVETVTASGSAATIVVANEDTYDAHVSGGITIGNFNSATFVSRYAGTLGNSIQVGFVHQNDLTAWQEDFTQNGKTATVDFGALFDRAPNTSSHVLSKNGGIDVNDEIHIVIVVRDGKICGSAGTVLEKFAHISLATDAKSAEGNSNYYKDVLRNNSSYIYATGNWANVDAVDDNWESQDSTGTTAFTSVTAPQSILLANGGSDNGSGSTSGNNAARRYIADKGYYLFRDVDSVDLGLVITGEDDATGTLTKDLIDNVAEYRKDAVVFYSIDKAESVNNGSQSSKGTALVDHINTVVNKNSSYAVMDSGWKRTYNRYTDNYVDVPLNGDIAGLCVATDQSRDAWWSPAGFSRGQIRNVVKLWFNPDKAERDKIYKVGVNPVVAMPREGTIL